MHLAPFVVIFAVIISFIPVRPVSAAIPSDAKLTAQAKSSTDCRAAVAETPSAAGESDDDQMESCAKAYIAGYKSPTGDRADYCNANDWGLFIALCAKGYSKGQADRKEADKQAAEPEKKPSGNLTTAQIKKLGQTHPICAELENADGQTNAAFADCVNGYAAGYQNRNKNATCSKDSVISKEACQAGYDAGKADKAANVKTAAEQTAANTAATVRDEANAKSPDEADVCDDLGALAWIVCPIVKGAVTAVDSMDNAINTLLTVETDPIFGDTNTDGTSSNAYYQAWNGFRTIALGLIVIASLVVIVATAFGYEILDAYTIRKVLPRVLIAIIFIALSWNILEFIITLTNDVGNGVRALIYRPFDGMGGVDFGAGVGIVTDLLLAGGLFAMGPLGILSFGLTALLAVIIAFLVLVIRELIIIFLVLAAPIGIACLILPNTRKGWQLWQNTFTAMLIVFPIISAMIATGRVFSMTVNTQGGGIVNELIAFSAYLLPYFLLPFAFRAAGGLMATLAGISNDRSRGAFDRLKGFRGNRMKKIHERRMAGNSWVGVGRTGNMYRRAAAGGEHGSWTPTRKGRARWHQEHQKHLDLQTSKINEEGGARAFNDDDASSLAVQRGMTRNRFIQDYQNLGHTRHEAEAALYRAEQATGVRMGSDAMSAAALKFRIASTNTAYETGAGGLSQMQTEVQDMVDRGLVTTHDAAGWMKSNRGRVDYSANAYGDTVGFLQGTVSAQDQIAGAFAGADPRDILGGHQRSVESFANHAQDHLSHALATGDQYVIDNAMADVANIHSILSSVSPKKAVEFENTVLAQPSGFKGQRVQLNASGAPVLDAAGNKVMEDYDLSIRQYADVLRGDERNHPAFHDRSREYSTAREAMAATPPPAPAGP